MQPESCDDEGDYQRANERRETECAFIWYAWMCACVNERTTERKNQRHRERERERERERSIQGRKKKNNGWKKEEYDAQVWIKIKRKNGRKRQIRDTQICDFELDV